MKKKLSALTVTAMLVVSSVYVARTVDTFTADGLNATVSGGTAESPSYVVSPTLMRVSSGYPAACNEFTYTEIGISKGFLDEAVFAWTTFEEATTSDVQWRVQGFIPWNGCTEDVSLVTVHSTHLGICLTLQASKTYEFQVRGVDVCENDGGWSFTYVFETDVNKVPSMQ